MELIYGFLCVLVVPLNCKPNCHSCTVLTWRMCEKIKRLLSLQAVLLGLVYCGRGVRLHKSIRFKGSLMGIIPSRINLLSWIGRRWAIFISLMNNCCSSFLTVKHAVLSYISCTAYFTSQQIYELTELSNPPCLPPQNMKMTFGKAHAEEVFFVITISLKVMWEIVVLNKHKHKKKLIIMHHQILRNFGYQQTNK